MVPVLDYPGCNEVRALGLTSCGQAAGRRAKIYCFGFTQLKFLKYKYEYNTNLTRATG
ncbi:hypothetical protein Lgor_3078 [Fluoribacter gormanii]|uniref:Uncharacterized protein n=1 Tax=Fluoribacter gormanii TaxID=464 RepID=A0A377GEU1_9GAMM|nr:hypothetical protein Lgor_3078 [Fluoribacter gormanii]SIR83612.1 hypothetical protein SAMN05421777_12825 [Fluoribacter gormanii]STO23331.1 Uncharacterised protein [Fluoribacter gormanii]